MITSSEHRMIASVIREVERYAINGKVRVDDVRKVFLIALSVDNSRFNAKKFLETTFGPIDKV